MLVSDVLRGGTVPLDPRDADFVYHESEGHPGHFLVVYLFDTSQDTRVRFTHDVAVDWTRARLGHHRMFTHTIQRVPSGIDGPYWAPAAKFDLRDHVQVTALTSPGWPPFLERLDAVLTSRMDLTRPPWELHFLTGVGGLDDLPDGLTAVALKAHHSVGDGLGVLEVARSIFSDRVRPAEPERPVPFLRGRMVARSVVTLPGQLLRFARAVPGNRAAGRAVRAALAAGQWPEYTREHPATRFNGTVSGAGHLNKITISTSRLRAVKSAVPGATVNDALLAGVGGALERYLAEKGESHRGSLVAMVPRSVRGVEEWESANQLVIMDVDMHTRVADPLDRLARIARSSAAEKARTSDPAVRRLAAAVETIPPPLQRLIAHTRKTRPYDLDRPRYRHSMVSNVPFTVDGLTLEGAPAIAVFGGQPPVNGDLLRHFVAAAADGVLTLTVIADAAAMPDPDHYLDLLRSSFEELERAAGAVQLRSETDESYVAGCEPGSERSAPRIGAS